MSGNIALMVAGTAGTNPVNIILGNSYSASRGASGGASSVTFFFNTDGTITVTGSPSVSGSPTASNWYTPTTTNIGSSYWVRYTDGYQDGGGAVTNNASTWTQLTANKSIVFFSDVSTDVTHFLPTFEISDNSSGSPVISTKNGMTVTCFKA